MSNDQCIHPEYSTFEANPVANLKPLGFLKESERTTPRFESEVVLRNHEGLQISFTYARREGVVAIIVGAPNLTTPGVPYPTLLQRVGIRPRDNGLYAASTPLAQHFAGIIDMVSDTLPKVLELISTPAQLEDLGRGHGETFR